MKLLTLEQLLEIHVLAVMQGGGSEGVRDLGRIESAIASQSQHVFGEELYSNIFEKAAAIATGIIGDHPFTDGNKRTAMLAAITLIEINNHKIQAKKGEIEDFAVYIATKKPDIPEIAKWFKAHSKN